MTKLTVIDGLGIKDIEITYYPPAEKIKEDDVSIKDLSIEEKLARINEMQERIKYYLDQLEIFGYH